jgi:predicted Zn-dependent protease with MMP-like domain
MKSQDSITFEDFQIYVSEALETMPETIKQMMSNVAVTVAEYPTAAQKQSVGLRPGYELYGLYQGVPLTQRTSYYGMVAPDRITIFMYPMVIHYPTPEGIRRQVQKTVLHEIGHHFGMTEKQLRDLGY